MRLYRYVLTTLLPALLLFSTHLYAGQISGTIRDASGPLAGVNVSINCGGKTGTGKTDTSGRYSIYVAATGSCTLMVKESTAKVFSSNQPTRHNFVLSAEGLQRQ